MLEKDFTRIQIVPMWKNKEEKNIEGRPITVVQDDFFENILQYEQDTDRGVCKYYYHGKTINVSRRDRILALFEYDGYIVAYGIVVGRVKRSDEEYIQYNDNNVVPYDGYLVLEEKSIDCVDPFQRSDLNKMSLKHLLPNIKRTAHFVEPCDENALKILLEFLENKRKCRK